MISRYESLIQNKFENIKNNVKIPNHLENQVALLSVKTRLIGLISREHAVELFDNDLLNFDDLDSAKSLDDVTRIIDNYLAIADFYEKNYKIFSWMIKEKYFQDKVKSSCLDYWNELLNHSISYKRLGSIQSSTFVMDVLSRVSHENKEMNSAKIVVVDANLATPPIDVMNSSHINIDTPAPLSELKAPESVLSEPIDKVIVQEPAVTNPVSITESGTDSVSDIPIVSENEDEEESFVDFAEEKISVSTSINLSKQEFELKLVALMQVLYDLVNDLQFWHKQVGMFCSGSSVQSFKNGRLSNIKIPKGIKEILNNIPTINNLLLSTQRNDVNQSLRCLSIMINVASKHDRDKCLFPSRGKESRFYKLLYSLSPLLDDNQNYAEQIKIIDDARETLNKYFASHYTPSNLTNHKI